MDLWRSDSNRRGIRVSYTNKNRLRWFLKKQGGAQLEVLRYIPCWDAECESLYKIFLQSPQGDDSSLAATALLAKLDRKRRDWWSEAVRSIDFSHSSQKAWSILNNLTGRSRHSPRHCPVAADAIASQLVRNRKYEAVDCKSSRLVFQEVSDLWKATTPDAVNISDNFSRREFGAALQHLKLGKAPGPNSICSKLILHAGAALKSWLRDFLPVCADSKFSNLEKSACGRDPQTSKTRGEPKELSTDISALCPLQDPREAYLRPRWIISRSTAI